ncbi:MAG: hypothetical protein KKC55_13780 [Gammaproteobacteria bacterium]|nr:hypothetical protein [Gammaproteobacteria bacterium]
MDFKHKKVVDYLKPDGKYLFRFPHGLGDTIMFYPLFRMLQGAYPDCQLDLYVECGQEEIWESIEDKDAPGYDEVFSLHFPMSEGSTLLKQQKCALEEIGFTPDMLEDVPEVDILPLMPSPLVALHFQGTALPNSVNCPEPVARQIWQEVKDFGKVPIEVHFQHVFHNWNANPKYPWIDISVRNYRATLPNLFGLIQRCWAFIGVASGPFVVALSTMPERLLYLERNHPLSTYTKRQDIPSVDVMNYRTGMVMRWLEQLKNDG